MKIEIDDEKYEEFTELLNKMIYHFHENSDVSAAMVCVL